MNHRLARSIFIAREIDRKPLEAFIAQRMSNRSGLTKILPIKATSHLKLIAPLPSTEKLSAVFTPFVDKYKSKIAVLRRVLYVSKFETWKLWNAKISTFWKEGKLKSSFGD